MCELLVRVNDKVNRDDFYLNCGCTKRGDVIVACPDGWNWGKQELINSDWTILKFPKIPVSVAESFLGPEVNIDSTQPSKTLQPRAVKINLDLLPQDVTVMASADLLALKVIKAPIPDPAIIGVTPNIF